MKKLVLLSLLLVPSSLFSDTRWMSPFIILYTINNWQTTQTFGSSVTFKDDTLEINGVTYNWPASATNGNCLQYNSGNLSWATCGSGGGGGGSGAIFDGTSATAVSTWTIPGFPVSFTGSFASYTITGATPTWTGSHTFYSTTTFKFAVMSTAPLILGTSDYSGFDSGSGSNVGIFMTANQAKNNTGYDSPGMKFLTTNDSNLGASITQVVSSYTIRAKLGATASPTDQTSKLAFINNDGGEAFSFGQKGLVINRPGVLGNETNWFQIGTTSMVVTRDGKVGIGSDSPPNILTVNTSSLGVLMQESGASGNSKAFNFPALLSLNSLSAANYYALNYVSDTYGRIANYQSINNALEFDFEDENGVFQGIVVFPSFGGVGMSKDGSTVHGMYMFGDKKIGFSEIESYELVSHSTPILTIETDTELIAIGTTTASSKLDILNGSITVRGTNSGIQIGGVSLTTYMSTASVQDANHNAWASTNSAVNDAQNSTMTRIEKGLSDGQIASTTPYRTISIPMASFIGSGPSSASWTNGGIAITSGLPTWPWNLISQTFHEFKSSTYSYVYSPPFQMPFSWDGSSVGISIECHAATGPANTNIYWSFGATAISSGSSAYPTFTSSSSVIATIISSNTNVRSNTASFNVEGTPAPGSQVIFWATVSTGDGRHTFTGIPRATALLVSYREAIWDGRPR